jgi:hypothetical protein
MFQARGLGKYPPTESTSALVMMPSKACAVVSDFEASALHAVCEAVEDRVGHGAFRSSIGKYPVHLTLSSSSHPFSVQFRVKFPADLASPKNLGPERSQQSRNLLGKLSTLPTQLPTVIFCESNSRESTLLERRESRICLLPGNKVKLYTFALFLPNCPSRIAN